MYYFIGYNEYLLFPSGSKGARYRYIEAEDEKEAIEKLQEEKDVESIFSIEETTKEAYEQGRHALLIHGIPKVGELVYISEGKVKREIIDLEKLEEK